MSYVAESALSLEGFSKIKGLSLKLLNQTKEEVIQGALEKLFEMKSPVYIVQENQIKITNSNSIQRDRNLSEEDKLSSNIEDRLREMGKGMARRFDHLPFVFILLRKGMSLEAIEKEFIAKAMKAVDVVIVPYWVSGQEKILADRMALNPKISICRFSTSENYLIKGPIARMNGHRHIMEKKLADIIGA